jgi:hypothetical protein
MNSFPDLVTAIAFSKQYLLSYGQIVTTEKWQGIQAPQPMFEAQRLYFTAQVPQTIDSLRDQVKPDLPWADTHFDERVSGEPLNPGESYKIWPWYRNDEKFRKNDVFTHTYMERMWPKKAGITQFPKAGKKMQLHGIRYPYGDLGDIIELIKREPLTRQAYLPIYFPEDTGATHGGRIPCSIGYHFMIRNDAMHIHYLLRSCDWVRHFRNDVYLTCRLLHHVRTQAMSGVSIGTLTMDVISLHCFDAEKRLI